MKKTTLFFLALLTFLLCFNFYTPSTFAANLSCSVLPNTIAANGVATAQLTITETGHSLTAWFMLAKKLPNGGEYLLGAQQISQSFDGHNSTGTKTIGPFDNGQAGDYVIYIGSSREAVESRNSSGCTFDVSPGPPPPTGVQCVNFVSIQPPEEEITSGSNIILKYTRGQSSTTADYKVDIYNSDSVLTRTVDRLTDSGSLWSANVGSLQGPEEVYSAKLYYIKVSPPHLCNSTNISILDERAAGQFPEGDDQTSALPSRVEKIVNYLITFGIGIAGGVAFLMLVYGGFKFIFSLGNPENVQQGREVITAAIIGLIVVVFSVFLLKLIGISILGLPI